MDQLKRFHRSDTLTYFFYSIDPADVQERRYKLIKGAVSIEASKGVSWIEIADEINYNRLHHLKENPPLFTAMVETPEFFVAFTLSGALKRIHEMNGSFTLEERVDYLAKCLVCSRDHRAYCDNRAALEKIKPPLPMAPRMRLDDFWPEDERPLPPGVEPRRKPVERKKFI